MQLSGLADEEAAKLDATWGGISSERKRGLLEKLIELGEENVELDFSHVFRSSLQDTDEIIRQRAVQGLWESDDRTLIGPLADMLLNDPSTEVRSAAAMSLGKFAGPGAGRQADQEGRGAGAELADAGGRQRRGGHGSAAEGHRGRRVVRRARGRAGNPRGLRQRGREASTERRLRNGAELQRRLAADGA